MNKQTPLYGLIFLLLASIGQETFAMKGFGQKASNYFRFGMKYLNYAGVLGYYPYIHMRNKQGIENELKGAQTLNAKSETYFFEVLYRAYPDLEHKQIKIVRVPGQSWATVEHNNTNHLNIPCDDSELEKAIQYSKTNTQKYDTADLKTFAENWYQTIPQYIISQENCGQAMTSHTLDRWHGAVLHEGSHIQHDDTQRKKLIESAVPMILTVCAAPFKKTLTFGAFLSQRPITANILRGIGYIPSLSAKLIVAYLCKHAYDCWQEYRADQDSIKCASNAQMLWEMSKQYAANPDTDLDISTKIALLLDPHDLPEKIEYLMDPHPTHQARAKYFAKAAQRLEEKQMQHTKDKA